MNLCFVLDDELKLTLFGEESLESREITLFIYLLDEAFRFNYFE